jgi:SHS family lactate transporter-like MFS transporter
MSLTQNSSPKINWATAQHYFSTRISTLKPPLTWPPNPVTQLRGMTTLNWLLYLSGFVRFIFIFVADRELAWTWDSFDFFSVSVTLTQIAMTLNKPISDVSWGKFSSDLFLILEGITTTLMFRPVGAIVFGIASDRYGRKWPLIINVILFSIVELATGFVQTYTQFISARCLFGVFMGGIVGNASATAIEDAPLEARGILSGLFLCGYGTGFLLATIFNLAFEGTKHGWRTLFWFGSGPAILIALFRAMLPETEGFKHSHKIRNREGDISATKAFIKAIGPSIKHYWLIFIYLVVFCSATNFLSHGSLDLYPTFLSTQLEFSKLRVTQTQVCAALGQIFGCIVMGYFSGMLGRRLTIITCGIFGGALVAPYVLLRNNGIMAAAFWEQW